MKVWLALAVLAVSACSNDAPNGAEPASQSDAEAVAADSATSNQGASAGKPGAPYGIDYRIIGTPVVGSPLTIELRVRSTLGPQPVTLDYRINDATAMTLAEAQPSQVELAPADNDASMRQQVTVIPMREGRLYLNVSAAFETADGTRSTLTAIPIQVGSGARQLEQNGRLERDENGEAVRVIDAEGG